MNSTFKTIIRGELRYHLREPLTILLLVILPVVLYPTLIWGYGKAKAISAESQAAKVLTVAGPEALGGFIEEGDNLRLVEGSLDPENIKGEETIVAEVSDLEDGAITLRFVGNAQRSREAKDRLMDALTRWQSEEQGRSFKALNIPITPGAILKVEEEDVSLEAARSGDLLGRIIPILLVFLLSSAGLHTALDVFTGEKDRGTLETLLTTRADRNSILLGKFVVVLSFTLVSGLLSLISLYATVAFGLIELPLESSEALTVGPGTLGILTLMAVPLAIQLAALLTAIASYAPDFRAGQALATPVVTVPALLAGVAAIPEVELSVATAMLPISNISLAAREALSGSLTPAMLALVLLMTTIHAGLALYGSAKLVGRETVILGGGAGARRRAKGDYSGVAIALYGLVMLLFWFLGQMAQAQDLIWGLILSQFFLIALPGFLVMVYLGLPSLKTLGFRAPKPLHVILAIVAGLTAPGASLLVAHLQEFVLPTSSAFSEQMAEAFTIDLPHWQVLLLFALLPGICEEILFRGAILSLLKKALKPIPRVIVVGFLFGLLHLALPRLLPTSSMGIILGAACLASGSLWIPILMHTLHNGLIVSVEVLSIPLTEETSPVVFLGMAIVCLGCLWGMTRVSGGEGSSQEVA